MEVDILGVDILRVEILGVDILRVDILGRTPFEVVFIVSSFFFDSSHKQLQDYDVAIYSQCRLCNLYTLL